MNKNEPGSYTNTIINSTVLVNGNLHIGNIFNKIKHKRPSIWDLIKSEYLKKELHNLIDIFLWDNTTGHLFHLIINNNFFSDQEKSNVVHHLEKVKMKLIPIDYSTVHAITPPDQFKESTRAISIQIDPNNKITFDDHSGPGEMTFKLSNNKKRKIYNNWTIQELDVANWFEHETNNIRLNLLFDKNNINQVFIMRNYIKKVPIHYFLVTK